MPLSSNQTHAMPTDNGGIGDRGTFGEAIGIHIAANPGGSRMCRSKRMTR